MTQKCYTMVSKGENDMERNEMKGVAIGERVADLRNKSGLTQSKVANILGVGQSYISKCEKGERQFSVTVLEKLASLFGCEVACLLNETQSIEPMNISYRSSALDDADYADIMVLNQIAINIKQMRRWLNEAVE